MISDVIVSPDTQAKTLPSARRMITSIFNLLKLSELVLSPCLLLFCFPAFKVSLGGEGLGVYKSCFDLLICLQLKTSLV